MAITLKTKIRKIKNVVKHYSEAETLARDATSNDPWGPQSSLLELLAQKSHDYTSRVQIMNVLWKRLTDKTKNWRHISKSLTTMEYLIKVGHIEIYRECMLRKSVFQSLSEYISSDSTYQENFDATIRRKAKNIQNLLDNPNFFAQESEKEKATIQKVKLNSSISNLSNDFNSRAQSSVNLKSTTPQRFDSVPNISRHADILFSQDDANEEAEEVIPEDEPDSRKNQDSDDIFEVLKTLDWSNSVPKESINQEKSSIQWIDFAGYFPRNPTLFSSSNDHSEKQKEHNTKSLNPFSMSTSPMSKPNAKNDFDDLFGHINEKNNNSDWINPSDPFSIKFPDDNEYDKMIPISPSEKSLTNNNLDGNKRPEEIQIIQSQNVQAAKFLGEFKDFVNINSLISFPNAPQNPFDYSSSGGKPKSSFINMPNSKVPLKDMMKCSDSFDPMSTSNEEEKQEFSTMLFKPEKQYQPKIDIFANFTDQNKKPQFIQNDPWSVPVQAGDNRNPFL